MERLSAVGCCLSAAKARKARPPALDPAADNRQPTTGKPPRALLAALLALAACSPAPPPRALAHEAYIWQRAWTPAVAQALRSQAPRFSGWRVLALQVVGTRTVEVQPDFEALRAGRLAVRAVVRIEGARERPEARALAARLSALRAQWRAAGLRVDGVEIDHDCASAGLPDYARWLRDLDAALGPGGVLSITALPDWLNSPVLDELLAAADASVLQVHAVDRPQRGLFDAGRAREWTQAWASRTRRPFLVALPAYGVRVGVNSDGAVRAVDAEGFIDRAGAGASELRADAREVAAFIAAIGADPPEALLGWIWFRLPVAGDRRGWSARQLAAVIAGEPLHAGFEVGAKLDAAGAWRLEMRNTGTLDAPPPRIELPADCRHGDGIGRYRLAATASLAFEPEDEAWLPAGSSIGIGWARCEQALQPAWSVR